MKQVSSFALCLRLALLASAISAGWGQAVRATLVGRVTDQSTQKPPLRAVVQYYPLFPNHHSSEIANGFLAASSAVIQPDGSFKAVDKLIKVSKN